MISDKELAVMLQQAQAWEARLHSEMHTEDLAERDSVLSIYRLVKPMITNIGTWSGLRMLRAQLRAKQPVSQ